VRRRFSSIYLQLTLVPYLCIAVFGMLPHAHGGQGLFFAPMGCCCAACLAKANVPTLGTVDNCALCQWQNAALVCSTTLPAFILPPRITSDAPIDMAPTAITPLIHTTSRAPPISPFSV
jgi:hypothetical protein